jgi:hypothetical protein
MLEMFHSQFGFREVFDFVIVLFPRKSYFPPSHSLIAVAVQSLRLPPIPSSLIRDPLATPQSKYGMI